VLVVVIFLDYVRGLLWGVQCTFVWVGVCLCGLRICLDLFDLYSEYLALYVGARTRVALVVLVRCVAAQIRAALVAGDHVRGRFCDRGPSCDRDYLDSMHWMIVTVCLVIDASYAIGPVEDIG
jgi:hypothetical protein